MISSGRSSHLGCEGRSRRLRRHSGWPTARFSSSIEEIHSPPDFDDVLGAIGDLHIAVFIDMGDVAGSNHSSLSNARRYRPL